MKTVGVKLDGYLRVHAIRSLECSLAGLWEPRR